MKKLSAMLMAALFVTALACSLAAAANPTGTADIKATKAVIKADKAKLKVDKAKLKAQRKVRRAKKKAAAKAGTVAPAPAAK